MRISSRVHKRERWQNVAAALILPFLLHLELSLIVEHLLPWSFASPRVGLLILAGSVGAGLVFLIRGCSYLAVLFAIAYVPALSWLVPTSTTWIAGTIFRT